VLFVLLTAEHVQVPPHNTTVVPAGGVATIIHRTLLEENESSFLSPYVAFNGRMFAFGGSKVNQSLQLTYDPTCCVDLLALRDGISCLTAKIDVTGNADTHGGVVGLYLYNKSDNSLSVLSAITILVDCKLIIMSSDHVVGGVGSCKCGSIHVSSRFKVHLWNVLQRSQDQYLQ